MSLQGRHVLIVEDEAKLAHVLRDYLQADGASVSWMADGNQVVSSVRQQAPDLILLDLMLPGRDGLSLCREIRSFSEVPIIMLTARVEEMDRLLGLDLGADDYICKPFSPREVVARVRTVLRRSGPGPTSSSEAQVLQLDEARFVAQWFGQRLDLTPVEFRLLRALSQRPGIVHGRAQIVAHLYEDHRVVSDRTVDSHVRNLRRKLQAVQPDCDPLVAVYGLGYKFQMPGET
ncbi:response regulator [Pseudomarimonas arenosa]|uniref:Response regulator n=1 Tax=Pseudomarimonas arenosa TaxID=2774145 RepID=A0AAW3ZER1_9GAMM|nr:response regulator [Pseudomarimonas arenosa]MBD8524596.1 response regulator [Pseudomarimonas arenosa]